MTYYLARPHKQQLISAAADTATKAATNSVVVIQAAMESLAKDLTATRQKLNEVCQQLQATESHVVSLEALIVSTADVARDSAHDRKLLEERIGDLVAAVEKRNGR